MVQPLLGTGRWLQVNGEAIYNSSGFPFGRNVSECTADGAGALGTGSLAVDKCFTTVGDTVYVIYLHWPIVPTVTVSHLVPSANTTVTLLGNEGQSLPHSTKGGMFQFEVATQSPAALGCDLDLCHAFVFKVTNVVLGTR